MIIPSPLSTGDTIGVMSPSSYITAQDLEKAKHIVESYGYKIYTHPQTLHKHHQSAGTSEDKLNAFHDLVRNPDIKAIIFSSGGNRALHWVDKIDFDLVKANPKIIMGFSDITSILNIVNAKTGLRTFHGPNLRWFTTHENNKEDIQQCFDILSNPSTNNTQHLVGGNASIMQYLVHDLDFAGKTLFLEDWNIETSHLDLIFRHFRRTGIFDQIDKLILGQFDNLLDTGRPYGFTIDDILVEHVPPNLSVTKNAPFGHGDRLITMPIG
tara:strand:+ start:63 stop:866 length:804 start_codon:yes stop_codon:yes gene_type:complete